MDELIALYLAGEANAEEQKELENWRGSAAENEHYFQQVQTIFNTSPKAHSLHEFNTDKAWRKVQQKINAPQKTSAKIISIFRQSEFLKVAAGFLLLLGFTYALNLYYKSNNNQEIAFASEKKVLEKTLQDGSVIHLNKKSQLSYSSDFNKKNRIVKLKGEAFFDVKHDASKPFTVQMEEVSIEDVGTSFNVKAYPDMAIIEVAVLSGEVKFYSSANSGIAVKAGEMAQYDKAKKEFSRSALHDKNLAAYRDKIFVFENTELHTVVSMLNDVYQCNIQFSNPKLSKCQLTVTFENESLDRIVEVIAATFNLKVSNTTNAILLEGEGCEK